jgi:hypothetical protein
MNGQDQRFKCKNSALNVEIELNNVNTTLRNILIMRSLTAMNVTFFPQLVLKA